MKRKKHRIPAILALLIAISAATFFFLYRVELAVPAVTLELGETVSGEPDFYLDGNEFAISRSTVDLSSVDIGATGVYEVPISHAWQHFVSTVTIQDTTPPILELKEETVYLKKGKEYGSDQFVLRAEDLSGEIFFRLCGENPSDGASVISYNQCGDYTLFIQAEDKNGNITEAEFPVTVDTAPVFSELPEYYIAVGSEVNYLEPMSAYDTVDGDLTEKITVDTSALNSNAAGEYSVFYSVTDAYGLTTTAENKIRVLEPLDLQDLINRHQINRFDQTIVGAPNPYDGGVYLGNDINAVLEALEPAVVCLKYDYSNGGWSRGSAFIIEITDEDVILCTNAHVAGNHKTMNAYFYEGTGVRAEIIGKAGKSCTEDDIAFARIKQADIPREVFDTLQTIHINEAYWEKLANQPNLEIGMRCILPDGSVWNEKTGKLLYKETQMEEYEDYGTLSQIGFHMVGGVSGSAIVDGYGNLVAMATSTVKMNAKDTYWAVNLEHILDAYVEILGYKPNYQ